MSDALGGSGSEDGPLVDFSALPTAALQRYAQFYGFNRGDPSGLLQRVSEHFAQVDVDEGQILSAFTLANMKSRGMRTPEETPKRRPASRDVVTPRKRKAAVTYGDMISHALHELPSHQGTLDEICDVIEKDFARQLNHELESGPRRIPVWRASVRKIINLNYGRRFQRMTVPDNSQEGNSTKAVFCLARTPR